MRLIRDRIPKMSPVPFEGQQFRMVNDAEVAHLLNLKLYEEVAELMRAEPSERLMEMADVLQVLHDLAKAHGFTPEQVEEARVDKFELLGGFSLGWALEWKPEANDR